MELKSSSELRPQEVQASVQVQVHKKALEQSAQALQLLESLPQVSKQPGRGGNVDIVA